MDEKKIVFSALKPTGDLTIGNYIGALKNMIDMTNDYDCLYAVADLHSLTVDCNPAMLRKRSYDFMAFFLAIGLDPEKCTLFLQSHVPAHAELAWILNCFTQFGEAKRMTQFKDKSAKAPQNVNVGLFAYPTLMAADILLYKADYVPVGKDQEQHLELTRLYARRFNSIYGVEFFPESQPYNFGEELIKIPGLDGSGKMGKSEGNCIYLSDEDKVIRKKVMKAVTDSGPTEPNSPISEPVANIFAIMKAVSDPDTIQFFKERYADCSIRYGDLKKQLAEDVIRTVAPIRERIKEIYADEAYLSRVVAEGAEKARASAAATVAEVRRIMGIHRM